MYVLLSGLMAAFCFVAAALLLRSYRVTHDRLFAMFAIAFPVLGLSQLFLGALDHPEADQPLAYIPRLVMFALIFAAIADKNRTRRRMRARLHVVENHKKAV